MGRKRRSRSKSGHELCGPTAIRVMNERLSTMDHLGPDSPEGRLVGGVHVLEFPERAAATVPMNYLSRERPLPPGLILRGSGHRLVPCGQSVRLFEALRAFGKDAKLYKLAEADHGGPEFWAASTLDLLEDFIQPYLVNR